MNDVPSNFKKTFTIYHTACYLVTFTLWTNFCFYTKLHAIQGKFHSILSSEATWRRRLTVISMNQNHKKIKFGQRLDRAGPPLEKIRFLPTRTLHRQERDQGMFCGFWGFAQSTIIEPLSSIFASLHGSCFPLWGKFLSPNPLALRHPTFMICAAACTGLP